MIKFYRQIRKKLIKHPPTGRAGGKVRNPSFNQDGAGKNFFYAIEEIIIHVIIQRYNLNLKAKTYRSPLGRG